MNTDELKMEKPMTREDVKDYITDALKGFETIVDAGIRNAMRVDNVAETMLQWADFCQRLGQDRPYIADGLYFSDHAKKTFERIRAIVADIDPEIFFAEDPIKDPFADLVQNYSIEDGDLSDLDIFKDMIAYRCVRPFGEKLEQLHFLVKDELAKIAAYEAAAKATIKPVSQEDAEASE